MSAVIENNLEAVHHKVDRIHTFTRIMTEQLQADVEKLLKAYHDLTGQYPEDFCVKQERPGSPDVVVSIKATIHRGGRHG